MALNFQQSGSASAKRVLLVALLVVSLALATLYAREGEDGPLHAVQGAVAVAVGPFKFVGAAAGAGASSVGEGVENLTADESTLSGLRESNEELRRRLAEADEYKQEAERLEGLLDLKKSYDIDGVAARIVGKSVEAYNQTVTLDVGRDDGVESGMTVMGATGVVGQVNSTDARTCEVRLLTDQNSGAAAIIQSNRGEGIVRGSLEGLLSAVFEAYARREDPQDVARADVLQPRLGQTVRVIETNEEHAVRVRRGIRRACGDAAYDAVKHASLSDHPDAGTIVYRFIRYAMAQSKPHDCSGCKRRGSCGGPCGKFACTGKARRSVLGDLAHPAVEPLHRLARSVMNERHRMLQFLRFEHLENGVWFARCNPAASVIPLLMDWFSGRFNTQPFIIFDEAHNIAGVYEGRDWYLVQTENVDLPDRASEERLMQQAWKRFYDTVAVEARYNPELRRQFMPKRFWKNITEMQEDLPGKEISPR